MGKKIVLSKKQLLTILESYSLGDLKKFDYFLKGQAHTNLLLETTTGKYVLKILSDGNKNAVQTDCEVVHFLSKNNFPTIHLIETKEKTFYLSFEDTYCFIYKYVEGDQVDDPNSYQLKNVAYALAKLHLASSIFSKRFPSSRVSKKFVLAGAKNSAKKLPDELAKSRISWIRNELNKLTFPETLSKSILHRDFSQENILFKGNKITAVLDMNALGRGFCIHDVASLIYFWAWFKEPGRKLNMAIAKKLVNFYQEKRPLSSLERNRLYDALVLRCLIYVSWELGTTKIKKDIKTNYYEFFKSLAKQVTSVGRDQFKKQLFG